MNLLTRSETADMFRVNVKTIDRWVKSGDFPQPIQVTPRSAKLWDRSELIEFAIQKRGAA